MPQSDDSQTAREAVGYFETADALQEAIDELLSSGFDRAELSLLASEHAIEEKLGHKYKRVEELEDDKEVPRTFFVSTEALGDAEGSLIGAPLYVAAVAAAGAIVATGGTVIAALAAATVAGGAGAFIGSAFAKAIGEQHAQYLEQQLEHGGLLLWVHAKDSNHEKRASAILKKHSGRDVHVHDIGG